MVFRARFFFSSAFLFYFISLLYAEGLAGRRPLAAVGIPPWFILEGIFFRLRLLLLLPNVCFWGLSRLLVAYLCYGSIVCSM